VIGSKGYICWDGC